jgi:hypothetical protein
VSDDLLKRCTLLHLTFLSFSEPLQGCQAAVLHKAITAVSAEGRGVDSCGQIQLHV